MKRLIPTILVLLVISISPVISLAGELEDALERVHINPNDAKAHYKLGLAYSNIVRYQEAIASYKEAIRLQPDYFFSHVDLGYIYYKLVRFQEAIASYKEAIRLQPNSFTTHAMLGDIYNSLSRYQEAIVSYKEALRSNSGYTYARNNLNKLKQKIADMRLSDVQDDFKIELAHGDHKNALENFRPRAEKGDPYAQVHMGWAYFHGYGVPKDYALAYMWYNLAAGNGNEQGVNGREQVEKLMPPTQIAEAQKLAREWMEERK